MKVEGERGEEDLKKILKDFKHSLYEVETALREKTANYENCIRGLSNEVSALDNLIVEHCHDQSLRVSLLMLTKFLLLRFSDFS